MSRTRKTDCWSASVRISIPIDATRPETIAAAQQRVREVANLIPGSTVEITHAGFGRMVAQSAPVAQLQLGPVTEVTIRDGAIVSVMPPPTIEPEIHASLRRVPRPVPNGGSPMDPSGDGSFRGPDGAAEFSRGRSVNIQVGQHWHTRGGATVEVLDKIDTGLMRYTKDWKPLGHAHLIRCRIIRCADGTRLVDKVCSYVVHDDGHYHTDRDEPLDLVGRVIEAAA